MKKILLTATSVMALAAGTFKAHSQTIDYGMMEELFGEPVTTSATGKPQRMSEAPVTMEILTQEDIRRSGAVNIPEALRQINGVNVVQRSELQYDVSIRGYNKGFSTRLLVLVNGRAVYLDHFGIVNWASIPVQLEEIRQIEVVKGPNTALFGFNAVSGVINIVTYNPLYDDKSSVGATWGTQDYYKGHAVHTIKPNDKVGVRISAGASRSNSFNNRANQTIPNLSFADGVRVDNNPENYMMNVDSMFQVSEKGQLRVEFSAGMADAGTLVPGTSYIKEKYETRSAKIAYDVDTDFGLIKANVYKNFLDVYSFNSDVDSTFPPQLMQNEILVAQLEDTVELNANHTIRISGEFRDNQLESRNGTFLPADSQVSYQVYSLGGMWTWKFNDKLTFTNAARVDDLHLARYGSFNVGNPYSDEDYNRQLTTYSYNSGLVFSPGDEDTLRLSTARGVEIPTLLEFGFIYSLPFGDVIGNPYMEPTVVTNYELAWDHRVDDIDGFLRSAVFYQVNQDIKSLTTTRSIGNNVSISDNFGGSQSVGTEVSLNGVFKEDFNWGIGYIFQVVDDDLRNGRTVSGLGTPVEFEDGNPQHQANLKLGYKKDEWEADTLVYYVSDTRQIGAGGTFDDIDAYVGVNARLAYTFNEDTIFAVHGQQLQQSQVQTAVTPDMDRRIFFSVTKKF